MCSVKFISMEAKRRAAAEKILPVGEIEIKKYGISGSNIIAKIELECLLQRGAGGRWRREAVMAKYYWKQSES